MDFRAIDGDKVVKDVNGTVTGQRVEFQVYDPITGYWSIKTGAKAGDRYRIVFQDSVPEILPAFVSIGHMFVDGTMREIFVKR